MRTSLGIIDEAVAAEQKGFTFLQISKSHMGFDKPAKPNVEYLAAAQAVIAIRHRRVSHSESAFTETRLIPTTIYFPTKQHDKDVIDAAPNREHLLNLVS